jgi:hypothetical protein
MQTGAGPELLVVQSAVSLYSKLRRTTSPYFPLQAMRLIYDGWLKKSRKRPEAR